MEKSNDGMVKPGREVWCDPSTMTKQQLLDTIQACRDEYDRRDGFVAVAMEMVPVQVEQLGPDEIKVLWEIERQHRLLVEDKLKRVETALREVEWGSTIHGPAECPSCGGGRPGGSHAAWDGHFQGCELAAAIGAPTQPDR